MFLFLVLIQGCIIGGFCGYLAGQKNRSGFNWFWLGFFFSFLALIAIAASPSIASQKVDTPADKTTRQCPFCAETVKAEALICRFCQHELSSISAPETTELTSTLRSEEDLMKQYKIVKENGQYVSFTYEGFFRTEKKHFFPSLEQAVKTMYGVEV
jgi:hypothetical protein